MTSIYAYPTDTSFALGAWAEENKSLEALHELKGRKEGQFFSLMVRDWEMLEEYAKVPLNLPRSFFDTPKTVILNPTPKLPKTKFWPEYKVAFRINQIRELDEFIKAPITATSANKTGEESIFSSQLIEEQWGNQVLIIKEASLKKKQASEIWDYTQEPPVRIR